MIVYSIIITALFMACLISLGYEHVLRVKTEDHLAEREADLFDLKKEVDSYRIEKANRDGVEAGRTTDAMYKSILNQFSAGEQVTVMLRRDDAEYYAPKN